MFFVTIFDLMSQQLLQKFTMTPFMWQLWETQFPITNQFLDFSEIIHSHNGLDTTEHLKHFWVIQLNTMTNQLHGISGKNATPRNF